MQEQQINLKWNSFHSNILSSFESMWEEEGLVDVTLATDGKCLKAHKIMLSASSPFFKKIFQMNPCPHPVIVLHDVQYAEIESILKFVYKGEVCISQDHLPLLLRAAETLQIRGLCRRTSCEPNSDENNDSKSKDETIENSSISNISPLSSQNAKRIKGSHNFKSKKVLSPAPLSSVITDLTVPVYPFGVDEIKHESQMDLPALTSESKYIHSIEPNSPSDPGMLYLDDEEQMSENFPFPPFPCPFCDRAYTRWGFRRRHIKACHTKSQSLPCKWCLEVLPTQTEWESHVCSKHSLSKSDAQNGLMILEEAEVVLQIPQPSRLDALVTMIKEHSNMSHGKGNEREENSKEMDLNINDNINDSSREIDREKRSEMWNLKW